MTPENIIIDFIKADASAGENWADVNLSAFVAACRAADMDVTESLDADYSAETHICGDVLYGGKTYCVSVDDYYGEVEAMDVSHLQV